eukprot:SAG25_NODE_347_length_9358_cov_86.358315_14_plen_66_part_00
MNSSGLTDIYLRFGDPDMIYISSLPWRYQNSSGWTEIYLCVEIRIPIHVITARTLLDGLRFTYGF